MAEVALVHRRYADALSGSVLFELLCAHIETPHYSQVLCFVLDAQENGKLKQTWLLGRTDDSSSRLG